MISFIVIGLNEGWRLDKCLKSICHLVEFNNFTNYEIIYVDSNSRDNSIEIARQYKVHKIYKISGDVNAAIARNVGAKYAVGECLFFLDGDIELQPFYFSAIINTNNELIIPFVVGHLDDVNYTDEWKFINQIPRSYKSNRMDKYVSKVGGAIFIIKKQIWDQCKGMDDKFKKNQDRDFSLRLRRQGIPALRKKEILGLHHTIPYKDKKRMWKMMFSGAYCYKALTIRRHLFNPYYFSVLIFEESSLIVLVLTIIFCFIFNIKIFICYLIFVLIRNIKHISNLKRFLIFYLHRIMQDIIVLFSILFFYPKKPKYTVNEYVFNNQRF